MIFDSKSRNGFTIVELLVAVSITVVIVVMLGSMFGSLASTSSRTNQRIDAFRDARAALQMMSRDLAALIKAQPAAYFQIDPDPGGADVRQISALVAARNRPDGAPPPIAGDVCAVRYYCAWDGQGYSLHRYFRNSDLTMKAFKANLNADGTLNYTGSGALYFPTDATDEAISTYSWNLQATALDRSGNVINKSRGAFGQEVTTAPYVCDPSGANNPLPAAIEVSFKAISPAAAQTVIATTKTWANAYDVWKVADNPTASAAERQLYERLIAPHAYDFRTRIYLK
jgi:type II secretory pathway pseudopilin PulG